MAKFRKIPVVIDAVQWTGENLQEVMDFTGKHPKWNTWFEDWKAYEAYVKANGNTFKIFTPEGTMTAQPGDWIIRGVKGEYYPCKPDIFLATYIPADFHPESAAPPQSAAPATTPSRDDARPSRCRPENYADGVQCQSCGRSWGEDGPDECPLEPLKGGAA